LALLVGLGRIHREQESGAASPTSALGPVHVLKITVLSTMLTDAVGVGEWGFSAERSAPYFGDTPKSLQNANIKARIEAVFMAGQHSSEV
jgi:hypothetical protein